MPKYTCENCGITFTAKNEDEVEMRRGNHFCSPECMDEWVNEHE